MEQIGEVVELRGRRALVRIRRTSSCGENCSSCSGQCTPTSTVMEVTNGLYAKVGDTVKVQMNSASFLFLAFIGYIFPILVCIGVYFLAMHFFDNVMIADAAALISLIAVLILFFIVDKLPRKSTRFSSRIIKILR